MPLYDYLCSRGHVTESQEGVGVESIPCPWVSEKDLATIVNVTVCGETAKRQAVYRVRQQGLRDPNCPGDIKNKHGQYRVKLWQESQAEAARRGGKT